MKSKAPYTARTSNEINLVKDQEYLVIRTDQRGYWWQAGTYSTHRLGWFPAAFVEIVPFQDPLVVQLNHTKDPPSVFAALIVDELFYPVPILPAETEKLLVSLATFLEENQKFVHPLAFLDYLEILQSLEEVLVNSIPHPKIHQLFSSVLTSAFDNNVYQDFNACIEGRREKFRNSPFVPDIHGRERNPSKYIHSSLVVSESFPISNITEEESKITLENTTPERKIEMFEKHGDVLVSFKKYAEALDYYYFIFFQSNNEIHEKINK